MQNAKLSDKYQTEGWNDLLVRQSLASDLNHILQGPSIYNSAMFAKVKLSNEAKTLLKQGQNGNEQVHLNRLLLADAYPNQTKEHIEGKPWLLGPKDINDSHLFAVMLEDSKNPVSKYLLDRLPSKTSQLIAPAMVSRALVSDLNKVLQGPCIYDPALFAKPKPGGLLDGILKLFKKKSRSFLV